MLSVVRSGVQLWPHAHKGRGGKDAQRPPNAFRKREDLSVKDGHVILTE